MLMLYCLPWTAQPTSEAFWQFSWDEMAKYDLPANVEYVLSWTGVPTLSYVGHSQGTIQAFSGLSINQTIANKVS
jgi:predicted alpha/beta hydrolase